MKISTLLTFGCLLAFVLGGCSFFTRPMENPVTEDKLGPSWLGKKEKIGTLSLTPERRVVLVNFANDRFCAEAPTEVGLNVSSLLNATGEADIPAKGNIALGLLLAGSSENSVLNKRSQAVQLFLANSYYICQMYMNGVMLPRNQATLATCSR